MGVRSFFSRMFASDDRSPWGDFWFEPIGNTAFSGARVNADTAMRLSAVFASVRLISNQFAMLPLRLYRPLAGGGKEIITDHWLYRLLAERPNQWQNPFLWRQMLQGHLELRGNAYNRIIANNRGQITDLIPIHPDRIKIELFDSGDYRYRVRNSDGSETPVPRGEIWHLRSLSTDGMTGMSIIDCARESVGMGLSAQEYASRFFANDQKPTGGWIEYEGTFKDKESRKLFTDSIREAITGAKRHGILTLDRNMKYHEVGVTNKDAQFLELRKFSVNDIARWFGVPPHKIGDLDRATFSNIEQQSLEFINDCLAPRAESWEAAIEFDLLLESDQDLEVEFDFGNLMRGDSAARAAYYASGIQNGWLTRNEVRLTENRAKLDGLDEPLQPLNMVTAGEQPAPADIALPAPQDAPADAPADDESAARLHAVVSATSQRLARRFMKSGALDATVIAEAFGLDVEAVRAWCANVRFDDEPQLIAVLSDLGSHQ